MNREILDKLYEAEKNSQFRLSATVPLSWINISLTLRWAADRLYKLSQEANTRSINRFLNEPRVEGSRTLKGKEAEDHWDTQMVPQYLLLMGYSLENLLKGILMNDNPDYFKGEGCLNQIKSHDLVSLCKQCGIPLQPEENFLLDYIKDFVIWRGKYPIPLESKDFYPPQDEDGSWNRDKLPFPKSELSNKVDEIYSKIFIVLNKSESK